MTFTYACFKLLILRILINIIKQVTDETRYQSLVIRILRLVIGSSHSVSLSRTSLPCKCTVVINISISIPKFVNGVKLTISNNSDIESIQERLQHGCSSVLVQFLLRKLEAEDIVICESLILEFNTLLVIVGQ